MLDKLKLLASACVAMMAFSGATEELRFKGEYTAVCRDADGTELWRETCPNLVVTVGKNQLLTNGTSTTGYLFLISATSFSAYNAADTMASHSGWLEAGLGTAPTYTGNRQAITWGAASAGAIAISGTYTFTMTGSGTVQGAGIVFGSGASATKDTTTGVLLSAGTFTGGAQPVISTNTVTVTYTLSA